MLSDETWDSFRAFSLDTITRIDEAGQIASDIRQERLPTVAVDPAIAELQWSIKNDPVAREFITFELDRLPHLLQNQLQINELRRNLTYLRKITGQEYRGRCEARITELCFEGDEKNKLRKIAGFYCSHILNLGYSRSFVLAQCNLIFFKKNHEKIRKSILRRFFSEFANQDHKFIAVAKTAEPLGTIMSKLGMTVYKKDSFVPKHIREQEKDFFQLRAGQIYVSISSSSKDVNAARFHVENIFSRIRAMVLNVTLGKHYSWDEEIFLYRSRSNKGALVKLGPSPLHRRIELQEKQAARWAAKYANTLQKNFDDVSFSRIIRSLTTSALARTSPNIENQLVSLWSSVEVLLPEPEGGMPRILHYVKILVPCIVSRYLRRNIVAIVDALQKNYKRKCIDLINSDPFPMNDIYSKFAAVVILPDRKPLRDRLVTLCAENPLALHRLYKLQSDISTPVNTRKFLEDHAERIDWQLHRIYRARNNLVHSGRVLPFVDSLVMNLDEYYRSAIGTIFRRAEKSKMVCNLSQLVNEIDLEHAFCLDFLARKGKAAHFTESDLQFLMNI